MSKIALYAKLNNCKLRWSKLQRYYVINSYVRNYYEVQILKKQKFTPKTVGKRKNYIKNMCYSITHRYSS